MPQYSAKAVANTFLALAENESKQVTNMQLQKLVYFANGWNLALSGDPLIKEKIKAWNFGPVIPPLYNALKKYGNNNVTEKIDCPPEQLDEGALKLIRRIWEVYGHLQGSQMSAITHQKGSAWRRAYEKEKFSIIDDQLIAAEFKQQMA